MKISVYITSYNQKKVLEEAIESVLRQSLKPFEIIVVDDFSTDGSQELIKSYAAKYDLIRYFFHERNKGIVAVRNTALANVQGEYVTYLDGDDLYLPNKLEIEAGLMRNNECDLVFTNHMYVAPNNPKDVKWIWTNNLLRVEKNTNWFVKTLTRDFPRQTLYRMELINYNFLKEIGFYDTNLKIYEDYELKIRIAKTARIAYSIEPTTKNRISVSGLSTLDKEEHKKAFKYIFRKYQQEIEKLESKTQNQVEKRLNSLLFTLMGKSLNNERRNFKRGIKKGIQKFLNKI